MQVDEICNYANAIMTSRIIQESATTLLSSREKLPYFLNNVLIAANIKMNYCEVDLQIIYTGNSNSIWASSEISISNI